MPGIKNLRKIQLGLETTSGTQVAATVIYAAESGGIVDESTIEAIPEQVGWLGGTNRSALTGYMGGLSIPSHAASFEQVGYWPAMSFGGAVTGVADGIGTGFLYTTNLPTTSAATLKTYTIEAGDNEEALEFGYGHCPEWTIGGAGGEILKVSATIKGQEVTTATFTAGLTPGTLETILASKGTVAIDAISGTYGTTLVASQVLAAEVAFKPTLAVKRTLEGTLDFSFVVLTGWEITGRLVFEHSTAVKLATSGGAKDAFKLQTAKKLRLKWEGSALVTPGTFTYKTLRFDLPIKWTSVSEMSDQDGNTTIDAAFVSMPDVANTTSGVILVVNSLSALA